MASPHEQISSSGNASGTLSESLSAAQARSFDLTFDILTVNDPFAIVDSPKEADARLREIESAGKPGNRRALPRLISFLQSPDSAIRRAAAIAMGLIGDPSPLSYLIDFLKDPDPGVRQGVAWALGKIGHRQAIGSLRAALKDTDSHMRTVALRALERIGDSQTAMSLAETTAAEQAELPHSEIAARSGPRRKSSSGVSEDSPQQGSSFVRLRGTRVRLVALTAIGLAVVIAGLEIWNRPLGPALSPLPAGIAVEGYATASPMRHEPLCDGPMVMNLLFIGIDSGKTEVARSSADVIRIARIDFTAPSVTLLAVPRDLWVTVPGLAEYGIYEDRVKTAFPFGNVYPVAGGGPSLLAQTLLLNFGLPVDHYLVLNFDSFAGGIDAIGGVEVQVTEQIGSVDEPLTYFPRGSQHLDGQRALRYARVRPENSSDLERIDRQTQIIAAIRDKLADSDWQPRWPELATSLQSSITTDLSPAEIASLICLAKNVRATYVRTAAIPSELYVTVTDNFGYERLLPDQAHIRQFVRDFQAGQISGASIHP